MAILGASFQIGRSALAAYQAAISITGQNIANVGNPDYTRQTGRLSALEGGPTAWNVSPGAGVVMSGLRRNIDEAVETRLRLALGTQSGSQTTADALDQVESLYNELSDQDLSTALSRFFASFSTLQTDPADMTARNQVVASADTVIRTMQRQRSGLLSVVEDLNASAGAAAGQASQIAGEVASLNQLIVTEQARGQGGDSPLKDRRDSLLRDLSQLADIRVQQQANGSVNVYIGSEPLVEFDRSRGLVAEREIDDGLEVTTVRFADNGGRALIRDGKLGAIIGSRDGPVRDQLQRLDQLAQGLMYEVNRVHSAGRGLIAYTSLSGSNAIDDPSVALNTPAAGVDFPIRNGTFLVHVRDTASGTVTTRQISVNLDGIGSDTSLNSLAAALNAVPGMSASVTADNRLSIQAGAGQEMWFSEDSSGAVAALGMAGFFTGGDAASIDVSAAIRSDVRLIAASATGEAGDGDIAGEIARVGSAGSSLLGNQSIQSFQSGMVGSLAVSAAAARSDKDAADTVYNSLLAQREAVSGVSVDEEAINLTKYERSFQAASRFLTVIDSLSTEVLQLVR